MYENLKAFRESLGLNQKEFARSLGLGLTTYNGYELGVRDPKSDFWINVAKTYHVSIDYLMGYEDDKTAPAISAEAMKIAKFYDNLDDWGRRVVTDVIADEQARIDAEKQEDEPRKAVPLFGQRFAAGQAEPDFAPPVETYEVPADSKADFAIHISGTSMHPYLKDGSIALGVRRYPNDGEVGAFMLDGEFLVKQFFTDPKGNVYLLSANRKEEDKDRVLLAVNREDHELKAFGTILTEKKLPRIYA